MGLSLTLATKRSFPPVELKVDAEGADLRIGLAATIASADELRRLSVGMGDEARRRQSRRSFMTRPPPAAALRKARVPVPAEATSAAAAAAAAASLSNVSSLSLAKRWKKDLCFSC
jgi:hypothetical protein